MGSLFMASRVVVAGTHSGVGKTTIATGLMAAFRAQGTSVRAAKVGPDFIDPGYHAVATGWPGRNLDAWMSGADAIAGLAQRAGVGAELLIIEGVMGLFDGADDQQPSSTADVARLLDAPVILVVDGASMGSSVAALVAGYRNHDPALHIAGVILNRVATQRHRQVLTEALATIGMPVLGIVPPDDALAWRHRHLGLVPVVEQPNEITASIARLADVITRSCDLDRIGRIARPSSSVPEAVSSTVAPVAGPHRGATMRAAVPITVAGGRAFSFQYPDNVEALEAAGAELISFDPLHDDRLPSGIAGVVIGGGFPEVFAAHLADNVTLLDDLRRAVRGGVPIWAECGGLLLLCDGIDDHRLAGVISTTAAMGQRATLGYRRATARRANPVLARGQQIRGHEYHYSTLRSGGDALAVASPSINRTEGFSTPNLFATYIHQHLGANPEPARRFVAACAEHMHDRH